METAALLLGSTVLTTLITLLANRHLRKSEVKKTEADVTEIVSKTYSSLIANLNNEITRMKGLINEMEQSKDKLVKQINGLETEVDSLRKQVHLLTQRLKKYES